MNSIDLSRYEPDPVFVNSRRETVVICILFILFMGWSVGVSYFLGEQSRYFKPEDPANIDLVWGMPSWVCYGVMFPWIAVNAIAIWFCFFFMKDDDLADGPHPDLAMVDPVEVEADSPENANPQQNEGGAN
ncbi:MAG: DUF997 family protein [Pirellulaceae bacterium]|jgi:hypothetical protein|nr:DUF997 family protein [Mariniblastus sp.]MDB4756750.1 YhdT family protein [Mariniblastus sp.]MDG2469481.1 DUF997 family protein [Pirellulaceae bacterium]